ncbi:hypothetical protein LMH87_000239 [Akanthomyces muscarius]|uniref:AT DNA binding protein n=1 Tax=Akanthomyces muscarius TaxID=2231603 RepID=A0A9W8UNF4_AKAMU|nr:hypothetical protein LMH87_000239 [Akanthomyces muscarius]KAJ4154969.1 hypothetical protein LMH87_000239 [Akanthomyces muscarius]
MAESSSNNSAASRQRRAQLAQQSQQAQQVQQAQLAQHTTATPLQLHIRRDSRPSESIDIERLLSSSFYPGSNTNYTFNDPSPSSSAGTVYVDDDNADYPERRAIDPESPDNDKPAKTKKKAPALGKAAGTKRKTDAGDNEGPGERRRKQIREAQRAYRQRKISQTAYLEERVRQLEGAIENMSSVVLSFSEELIGSNILSCQSDLTSRLRDALATCLTLVRETGTGSMEHEPAAEPSIQHSMALVPSSIPPAMPNKPTSIKNIFGNKPYPDMNTSMPVAAFMDMLATSAVYYGYLALADPTLSTTRLHRHFGLPLQLMNRDKLLSYFSHLFQTRLCRAQIAGDERPAKPGMPFFSIGGAGTHYSPVLATSVSTSSSSSSRAAVGAPPLSLPWANTADQCSTYSERRNEWTVPMDPSSVPANIQDRFEGDWFDMQDLELYLLERGVSLRMKPEKESHGDINVPLFLRGLMLNTTCLGQSPGFRRRDVEIAMQAAQCGPQA